MPDNYSFAYINILNACNCISRVADINMNYEQKKL